MSDRPLPRPHELWIFRSKVALLRVARTARNLVAGPRHHLVQPIDHRLPFVEHRSKLRTALSATEYGLQSGKIQNLRIAVRALNGVSVPAGEVLSFWRQVGPPWRTRGFVAGRELQQGCIVPGIGGGLCQLSNALYDLALRADLEIVERHPHTRPVPGSAAEVGRDATVAWNHIDLRLRAQADFQVEALLTADELVVRLYGLADARRPVPRGLRILNLAPGSCETCGRGACFRHDQPMAQTARETQAHQAFLLDGVTPEFTEQLHHAALPDDIVLTPSPLSERYLWPVPADVEVRNAPFATVRRMGNARRGGSPAQVRDRMFRDTQRVSQSLVAQVPVDADRVTLDLVHVATAAESGALGGREVTVWITRFPLRILQELLDRAADRYPDAGSLRDFRVVPREVEAEWAALQRADHIVCPHPLLAARLSEELQAPVLAIPWCMPPPGPQTERGDYVYFPGPTIEREGALAVREAARGGGFPLVVGGRNLSDPGFWDGVPLLDPASHPMEQAGVVVAPAVAKFRPTALLQALRAGIPVIATPACGVPGAHLVEFGDADGLTHLLSTSLNTLSRPNCAGPTVS